MSHSDNTFKPCIQRAIFATWIILSSVQSQPSIPDPLLYGWKMAEGGVDVVVSSYKEYFFEIFVDFYSTYFETAVNREKNSAFFLI